MGAFIRTQTLYECTIALYNIRKSDRTIYASYALPIVVNKQEFGASSPENPETPISLNPY